MQSLANVGTFAVGATVEAQREDGDDEYEPATVKGFDPKSATLSLLFADGFKAGGVPLSRVKLEQGTVEPPPPTAAPPTTTPADDDARVRRGGAADAADAADGGGGGGGR